MGTITLKIWITFFFGAILTVIYSFAMFMRGEHRHFVTIALGFIGCLAMYHFVLKEEFEKMQKEYEDAGSLKKIVKKWKGSDTE